MIGDRSTVLEVVSYNIHKGLTTGNLRVALEHMRLGLRQLAPDIVLVQEVVGSHQRYQQRFHNWPTSSQFEFLADRMWPYHAYGRNAVYSGGDHGNAILSRFPIVDHENIDISQNSLEQRGILHAVVDVPGLHRPLHACCTHLNLLHGQRKRQLAALAARVDDAVPHDCPLIIGGDFNDWRTWATRALRRTIGVREVHVHTHGRHARTYPGWQPLLALDRIYVRGLDILDAGVLDGPAWRSLSDHLGVHTKLRAPRAQRPGAAHRGAAS